MKKIVTVLLTIFCLSAIPALALDNQDVGFTKEGIFYVSDDLVQKAGFGAPTLNSSLTGWGNDMEMKLQGKYWTVATGKKAFGVVTFCYQLGYSNMWLPHVMIDQGMVEAVERYAGNLSIVDNKQGGYNFVDKAVAKAPF